MLKLNHSIHIGLLDDDPWTAVLLGQATASQLPRWDKHLVSHLELRETVGPIIQDVIFFLGLQWRWNPGVDAGCLGNDGHLLGFQC